MNIIRTKTVELSSIPALAFKQMLECGGAGVKIIRLDRDVHATAVYDNISNAVITNAQADEALFPYESFEEALELLAGFPFFPEEDFTLSYSNGANKNSLAKFQVFRDEYEALVERFSDENGRMNFNLMNKNFISFATKSKMVSEMIMKNASAGDVLVYVVKIMASFIANKDESLEDELALQLIEILEQIDPGTAFKELSASISRRIEKR